MGWSRKAVGIVFAGAAGVVTFEGLEKIREMVLENNCGMTTAGLLSAITAGVVYAAVTDHPSSRPNDPHIS